MPALSRPSPKSSKIPVAFSKVTYLFRYCNFFATLSLCASNSPSANRGGEPSNLPQKNSYWTKNLGQASLHDCSKGSEAKAGTNPAVLRPGLHTLQSDSRHVLGQLLAESGRGPCPGKNSPVVFASISYNLGQRRYEPCKCHS